MSMSRFCWLPGLHPSRVPQIRQHLGAGSQAFGNELLRFRTGIRGIPSHFLVQPVELLDVRIGIEKVLLDFREWILQHAGRLNQASKVLGLDARLNIFTLELAVNRLPCEAFQIREGNPAIVIHSYMHRLRCVGYKMTEYSSVSDYVLLELLSLGRVLWITPLAEKHHHFFIAFEHRVGKEPYLDRIFSFGPQPVRAEVAVGRHCLEEFLIVDIDEVVGCSSVGQCSGCASCITPAVRFRPKE